MNKNYSAAADAVRKQHNALDNIFDNIGRVSEDVEVEKLILFEKSIKNNLLEDFKSKLLSLFNVALEYNKVKNVEYMMNSDLFRPPTQFLSASMFAAINGNQIEKLKFLISITQRYKIEVIDRTELTTDAHIAGRTIPDGIFSGYQIIDDGNTALYVAIKQRSLDAVKEILKSMPDLNKSNKLGIKPLYWAVFNGDDKIVEHLLAHAQKTGVIITEEVNGDQGSRALHIAAQKGHLSCMKQLINAGASLEVLDKDGFNSLHIAVTSKHLLCVKQLLKAGVDIEVEDRDGFKALFKAVTSGQTKIAQQLLKAGASFDIDKRHGSLL